MVVVPYWTGDFTNVTNLAKLITSMQSHHAGKECWFFLAHRQDCPPNHKAAQIFSSKFRTIQFKCNSPQRGYPAGSNGQFASCMLHMRQLYSNTVRAVLWLEPDAFPIRRDWIQRLMNAWNNRKPGVHVLGHRFTLDGSDKSMHINGVSLYAPNVTRLIPTITMGGSSGWDWAQRGNILKSGDDTTEIRYTHLRRDFKEHELDDLSCSVFHGVKDNSLLEVLGKKYGFKVE